MRLLIGPGFGKLDLRVLTATLVRQAVAQYNWSRFLKAAVFMAYRPSRFANCMQKALAMRLTKIVLQAADLDLTMNMWA
jgi:hypothetical protein